MWYSSNSGKIELQMTLEQARSASHQGQCDSDVRELSSVPASSFHPAINVKVQRAPEVDAPDDIRSAAWDEATTSFWHIAGIIAVQHGYSGVFSEGRSNGWLVPYTQRDAAGKLVTEWTGQGPDVGYPVYPDVEDKAERCQFIRFRAAIESLLRDSLTYYVETAQARKAHGGAGAYLPHP